MKYTVTFFTLLFACLICGGDVNAACGGGGFKPTRDKPSAEIQTSNRTVNVSYQKDSSSREIVSPRNVDTPSFSSRYDAVVNDLKVSSDQYNDISNAKHDIGNKLSDLQRDVEKASNKLARCSGNCDKEQRKLAEAQSRLNEYDAKGEFDRRVGSVLSDDQLKTYRSSK